ncbi:Hsp20/alpha crystallin family protein [Nitrosococcus watsonii]|uniref:Heat shock protein Hsp20 n=1 Tax=Nitrosococcus watsoni (strain C-113) TaxID=105559 RepID=D8K6P2_NITWC|nr:Hsp20/alpha crystallin family protein [Nitrosococcus watsonii]ADJ28569.1 heat shock protein Hsp20 [Nitrosococcus watsonii C-113]
MATYFSSMKQVFINSEEQAYQESVWQPPADIYRIERGWLVKLDLAGIRNEDIHLSIHEQRLVVQGLRRDWIVEAGQQYYSMEIAYNRFRRAIEFPASLEQARITTKYRDGMLLIWLEITSQEGL